MLYFNHIEIDGGGLFLHVGSENGVDREGAGREQRSHVGVDDPLEPDGEDGGDWMNGLAWRCTTLMYLYGDLSEVWDARVVGY